MKIKTFILLVVVLAFAAGGTALIFHLQGRETPQEARQGMTFLPDFPVNEIQTIAVESPQASVVLKRETGGWVVENRDAYPADFGRIVDLARTLKDLKVGRQFPASGEVMERLALYDPGDGEAPLEARGTRLHVLDEQGRTLLDLVIGSGRAGAAGPGEGQYVLPLGKKDVVLVDRTLSGFEPAPGSWLARDLLQIPGDLVQTISCAGPGGEEVRYVLERPQKNQDFQLKLPATGDKLRSPAAHRLSNALSSLRLEDVRLDASLASLKHGEDALVFEYGLYDHRVYQITLLMAGEEKGRQVSIEAFYRPPGDEPAGEAPNEQAGEETAPEKAEVPPEAGPDMAETVRMDNERLQKWVFVLPEWQYKAFVTRLEDLIQPEDETPSQSPS